jgi:hypothetical protein
MANSQSQDLNLQQVFCQALYRDHGTPLGVIMPLLRGRADLRLGEHQRAQVRTRRALLQRPAAVKIFMPVRSE